MFGSFFRSRVTGSAFGRFFAKQAPRRSFASSSSKKPRYEEFKLDPKEASLCLGILAATGTLIYVWDPNKHFSDTNPYKRESLLAIDEHHPESYAISQIQKQHTQQILHHQQAKDASLKPAIFMAMTPSLNSARVKLYLAERGIEYIPVKTDPRRKSKVLSELNPRGNVPVLIFEGVPVSESIAILLYGDSHLKGKCSPFIPEERKDEALMLQRMVEVGTHLKESQIFEQVLFQATAPESLKPLMDNRFQELKKWDEALADKKFLANTFSTADIAAFHPLYLEKELGLDTEKHLPHLDAWLHRMLKRPNVTIVTQEWVDSLRDFVPKWDLVWKNYVPPPHLAVTTPSSSSSSSNAATSSNSNDK